MLFENQVVLFNNHMVSSDCTSEVNTKVKKHGETVKGFGNDYSDLGYRDKVLKFVKTAEKEAIEKALHLYYTLIQ